MTGESCVSIGIAKGGSVEYGWGRQSYLRPRYAEEVGYESHFEGGCRFDQCDSDAAEVMRPVRCFRVVDNWNEEREMRCQLLKLQNPERSASLTRNDG